MSDPARPSGDSKRLTLGLALSGGSARAIASIGVLDVLESAGLPVSYLAGSSAGALIAVLYAAGLSPREIEALALDVQWRDLVRMRLRRLGFLSSEGIDRFVRRAIGDVDLSDLRIPVSVMATDLVSGQGIALTRGPAGSAVQASSSIPEIFSPVRLGPYLLVDGGLTDYMPCDVVRTMGADVVVGVNVVAHLEFDEVPRHLMQLILRVIGVVAMNNARRSEHLADFVIRPDVGHIPSTSLERAAELIERGRAATRPLVPAIRDALSPPLLTRLLQRKRRSAVDR